MQNSIEFDKELFQEMVCFYGHSLGIPPLAAKIYAYLVFDFQRKGVVFDELVDVFAASKSSISSNLQILQNLQLITDFNKIDERKRYFQINTDYPKIRFTSIVNDLQKEVKLMEKLYQYNSNKTDVQSQRFEIYTELLYSNIKNINETLNKLYD